MSDGAGKSTSTAECPYDWELVLGDCESRLCGESSCFDCIMPNRCPHYAGEIVVKGCYRTWPDFHECTEDECDGSCTWRGVILS